MNLQSPSKSSVIGVVFSADRQQVLIVKRRDVPVWVLPGGGVDKEEPPSEAIVREVFEETGLQTEVVRLIAEYTPINRLAYFTQLYECKVSSGEISTSDETCEVRFCPIEQLPETFFHIHLDWLQDVLLDSPEVIRKPIDNVTYFRLFLYFCRHPWRVMRFLLTLLGFPLNA